MLVNRSPQCTVVARPNMFDPSTTVFAQFTAGQTIATMLGPDASIACAVTIGGHPVPRRLWDTLRPKVGQVIHVALYPQGGGNGSKWLRVAAMLVVSYFSYGAYSGSYFGMTAGSFSSAALAAGISVVGMMAVNALIPPPSMKMGAGGDAFGTLQSLTGTSNQINPYGVIPCVIGQAKFFPPHAAQPYSEISGDDDYMRCMFDLGDGDLEVSDIKIGETPIEDFDDVDYEITKTPTLFVNDVHEEALNIQPSDTEKEEFIRTTQAGATEISVDFAFPQGLFAVNSKGHFVNAYRNLLIDFRRVGTETWYGVAPPTPGISISSPAMRRLNDGLSAYRVTSNANKQLRIGVRWKVAAGQYEVRITTAGIGYDKSVSHVGTMVWTALRSFSPKPASSTGTLKLCMRIRATDQLNGVLRNVSVLAQQRIPTWNKATGKWTGNVATTNAAWIYAWLLTRCPAVVRRLGDDRLNLRDIADWAAECEAKSFRVGFVMDSARAFSDVLRDVLAAGRASFGVRNGKYGPVRDKAQSVPVQMFTPKNSSGFSYTRDFTRPPHALRVTFTNPEADWQQDVITVLADGYQIGGRDAHGNAAPDLPAATLFEQLDARMLIEAGGAWRLGRYHLAVMRARPVTYPFQADIEHLVCERGDLIHVAHDIIGWGLAHGRVKWVDGQRIVLDETLQLDPGKRYMIRVRRSDNAQVTSATTAAYTWDSTYLSFDSDEDPDTMRASTRSFTLAAPLDGVKAGDLFVVGEVNRDVARLVVKSVEPGADLSATITAVDYSDAVIGADAGAPPTFVSQISGNRWEDPPDPPVLNIRVGSSASDQMGSSSTEIGYGANATSGVVRLPPFQSPSARSALA